MEDIKIWEPAIGYEGRYEITNNGRCRTLLSRKKELKPLENKYGYLYYILTDSENKRHTVYIHRLVALSFIPNPHNLPEINHKDENKKNNNVENLEWCDRKYNINYGTCTERGSKKRINGKKSKPVLQFSLSGDLIREWPSMMEAYRNGFQFSAIWKCCRGKKKTYKGYVWKYK